MVREISKPGDLVIDLDEIKRSVSGLSRSEFPDSLLDYAIRAREFVVDLWKAKRDCDLWYVTTMPDPSEREDLAIYIDATVIVLEVSAEQCAAQLIESGDDVERRARLAIEWWQKYRPRAGDEVRGSIVV